MELLLLLIAGFSWDDLHLINTWTTSDDLFVLVLQMHRITQYNMVLQWLFGNLNIIPRYSNSRA